MRTAKAKVAAVLSGGYLSAMTEGLGPWEQASSLQSAVRTERQQSRFAELVGPCVHTQPPMPGCELRVNGLRRPPGTSS